MDLPALVTVTSTQQNLSNIGRVAFVTLTSTGAVATFTSKDYTKFCYILEQQTINKTLNPPLDVSGIVYPTFLVHTTTVYSFIAREI